MLVVKKNRINLPLFTIILSLFTIKLKFVQFEYREILLKIPTFFLHEFFKTYFNFKVIIVAEII